MNVNQLVLESLNYEIKPSGISGKGVFAKIPLSSNVNLGTAFIKHKNTTNPDVDYSRTDLGAFVNHSISPNIKIVKSGKIYLYVTTTFIKKGQELLIDYRTFPWEGERSFIK